MVVSSSRLNTTIIDSAVAQGWLTSDQERYLRDTVQIDPSVSVIEIITDQGWLSAEHIQWLQQNTGTQASATDASTPSSSAEASSPAEPASSTPPPAAAATTSATTTKPKSSGGGISLKELRERSASSSGSSPGHGIGNSSAKAVHSAASKPKTSVSITSSSSPQDLESLHSYLKLGVSHGASDIHIGPDNPPRMRRFGSLVPLWDDAPNLTADQTQAILFSFLPEDKRALVMERGDVDFCYEVPDQGRFRASVVRQRLGYEGVFRVINTKVRTMDELGLPQYLKNLTKYHNGLILVTGSMGSGKSTTLAAFIEEVNRERHDHIITLEDPIEYVFQSKGCQITQREVHTHTQSFGAALRAALREDPDVMMVGEMRDLETIQLAITASETGHLVLGTLHTSSAARTLDRLLDVFPIAQQAQIRTMVSGSLRGIISQQLVPKADGNGRALAMEVLINSPAAAALIREGKTFMLPGVMQTGKKIGCKLMDDSLMSLLEEGAISAQDAHDRAEQKAAFKPFLKR